MDGEDPLETGMANHSSILAWRIPRTEEPGRLQSMGLQRVRHDQVANTHTHEPIYSILEPSREKAMAAHSSTLAWKIPWTEEPGGLQSMGSLRVGHD